MSIKGFVYPSPKKCPKYTLGPACLTVCALCLSLQSAYVTGNPVIIDGGWSLWLLETPAEKAGSSCSKGEAADSNDHLSYEWRSWKQPLLMIVPKSGVFQ